MDLQLRRSALEKFRSWYGTDPVAGAYAPGRVEVLGNHTDYNEGFVLSAAIDYGTVFLASPNGSETCRLVAGDLMNEVSFSLHRPTPFTDHSWPNYVMGVTVGLVETGALDVGFDGLFFGNVPIGSGLSSSAALEISAGTCLASMAGSNVEPLVMAKIGQRSEHEYVGAKTGLLDQISSLFGREDHLVRTDFRSLEAASVPFPDSYVLLVCDTQAKHSLGESDYNERRTACETAKEFFSMKLDTPVSALRDVSSDDLHQYADQLDPTVAKRAAHVIGENERVLEAELCLESGDIVRFGELMFASHQSSRTQFENSCDELDVLVDQARADSRVLGARLSGGGFGGSVVMLVKPEDADAVTEDFIPEYRNRFGSEFEARVIRPSAGASSFDIAAE